MKTNACRFAYFCLLFCFAWADVSELLNNKVNREPEEIQTCIILTNRRRHEESEASTEAPPPQEVTTTSQTEVPTAVVDVDLRGGATEDSVSVEMSDFQLKEDHPDFQGPYHYQTPKIPLEYAAPLLPVTTEEQPPSAGPEGRNEEVEVKDYLPPAVPNAESVPAKRYVRRLRKATIYRM